MRTIGKKRGEVSQGRAIFEVVSEEEEEEEEGVAATMRLMKDESRCLFCESLLPFPRFFLTWWCCTPRSADAPAVGAVLSVTGGVKLEDGARVSGMRVINQCVITNHPCGSAKEEKGKGVGEGDLSDL